MAVRHKLLGGDVQVFRRPNSPLWQCSASVGGRQFRASTKCEGLSEAKDFAEDWYLTLKGKHRYGGGIEPTKKKKSGPTFSEAGEAFVAEYTALMSGQRNAYYIQQHGDRLRVHLNPFFGEMALSEITPGAVQNYRIHRQTSRTRTVRDGDEVREVPAPPARATLHAEIVTLRMVLKSANRRGLLPIVPDLSPPFRGSKKVQHRAWFSPSEYQRLYEATRERAKNPPHNRGRWRYEAEQLHDYVLFMVNTGLRPDEAARLEFRDVAIVLDQDTRQMILEIEARGKRGVGYCKSMPGAVKPFRRLMERHTAEGEKAPKPTERLFRNTPREMLNRVLDELDLKRDRDGRPRTSYSLRHTYICLRLMEGADIYQVAKNCRTSVEIIETHYAAHIKNMIDASAINVRRSKSVAQPEPTKKVTPAKKVTPFRKPRPANAGPQGAGTRPIPQGARPPL